MTTRTREAGGGSWFRGGHAGEESLANGSFGDLMSGNHHEGSTALGGHELHQAAAENVEQQEKELDADIFQLSYPRLRLRWTEELHDKFVKAVDQLGGENLATPKEIKNVMRIPGLTLYHLKSHLQKYRLGKMGRKLWRREFVPSNYNYRPRARGARVPPEAGRPSNNISNVFGDINGNINALGAEMGNMHQPQSAAVENLELAPKVAGLNAIKHQHVGSSSTSSAVKMEEQFAADRPASLLPLFPPIADWPDFQGGGRAVTPPPPRPASVDAYLNSLGCSSSESGHQYPYNRGGTTFGSFFDEVASLDDTSAMGAHDLSAGFANFYYP